MTQGLEGMLESRIPHAYQNAKVVAQNLADCSHSTKLQMFDSENVAGEGLGSVPCYGSVLPVYVYVRRKRFVSYVRHVTLSFVL